MPIEASVDPGFSAELLLFYQAEVFKRPEVVTSANICGVLLQYSIVF